MILLNRFETNLLDILQAMLGDQSPAMVMSKILQAQRYPGCLSREAVRLVERSLAKGMTAWLARQGWHGERFLRDDATGTGAIWQRTRPEQLGLRFSKGSLHFLVWLTSHEPLTGSGREYTVLQDLELGDQLLLFRMLTWLGRTPIAERWFSNLGFASLPLVSLHYPDEIDCQRWKSPDFTMLLQPTNAFLLECMQSGLADKWTRIETSKRHITDVPRMNRLGQMQQAVLSAYLDALELSGRRDLARFLLIALQRVAGTNEDPVSLALLWVRSLETGTMRLADRTRTYHSASTFLAYASRLRNWTEQCKRTGYFDEGYATAQLWLADWERYDGERVTLRALAMVRRLTDNLSS